MKSFPLVVAGVAARRAILVCCLLVSVGVGCEDPSPAPGTAARPAA